MNFDVLVLRAFALDGRVDRPVVYNSQLHVPQAMRKPLADFEQFCRERLHLRPTSLKERIRTVVVFLNYLGANGITALEQLQPAQVTSFVISRGPRGPRSASRGTSDLRSFLRYLLQRQIVNRDLTQVLPTIRVPLDGTIPSVWDPDLARGVLEGLILKHQAKQSLMRQAVRRAPPPVKKPDAGSKRKAQAAAHR